MRSLPNDRYRILLLLLFLESSVLSRRSSFPVGTLAGLPQWYRIRSLPSAGYRILVLLLFLESLALGPGFGIMALTLHGLPVRIGFETLPCAGRPPVGVEL